MPKYKHKYDYPCFAGGETAQRTSVMHCWLGVTELGLQPTFPSVLSIALPHGLFL